MRLIRISGLSVILFALILIVLNRPSPLEAIPVLALGANDCQPPCWFSLEPGKTTRGEMAAHLAQYPELFTASQSSNSFNQCWQIKRYLWQICIGEGRDPEQVIQFLRFLPPRGTLSLGRAFQHFGRPIYTLGCLAGASPQPDNPFRGMSVQFGEAVLVDAYNVAQNGQALTPYLSVEVITYGLVTRYDQAARDRLQAQGWHGFGQRSIFPILCSFP